MIYIGFDESLGYVTNYDAIWKSNYSLLWGFGGFREEEELGLIILSEE